MGFRDFWMVLFGCYTTPSPFLGRVDRVDTACPACKRARTGWLMAVPAPHGNLFSGMLLNNVKMF